MLSLPPDLHQVQVLRGLLSNRLVPAAHHRNCRYPINLVVPDTPSMRKQNYYFLKRTYKLAGGLARPNHTLTVAGAAAPIVRIRDCVLANISTAKNVYLHTKSAYPEALALDVFRLLAAVRP